ncbi:hypothetical protein A2U01_0108695, partial [Trifolium medium]|nr:hypothetical protein [Trifolium medium]
MKLRNAPLVLTDCAMRRPLLRGAQMTEAPAILSTCWRDAPSLPARRA